MSAVQAATIGRDAGARRVVLAHFSQREPSLDRSSKRLPRLTRMSSRSSTVNGCRFPSVETPEHGV